MDIVNEGTTYRVVAEFNSEGGVPVTPSSITYRLDDKTSGTELIDDTIETPTGSSHVITIPFGKNTIIDSDNSTEEKVLTVVAQYGTAKQCVGEFTYKVRNITNYPLPTP